MDKTKLYTPIKILSVLLVLSFLLPAFKIGGFGMKLDLILLFPLLFLIYFVDRAIKRTKIIKILYLISISIFIVMVMADSFGLLYFFSGKGLYFPTEFIQILSRVFVFYSFYFLGYSNIFKGRSFFKLLSLTYLAALTFGLLQSLNIPIVTNLSTFYALSDVQVQGFESIEQRGFGVAGNIISWGGISGMLFFFFYFIEKRKLFQLIGCFLAIVNLFFSASRSSIVSFLISFILVKFIEVFFITKNFKGFIKVLLFITFTPFIALYIFQNFFTSRYELMLKRFSNLDDALNDTGRGAQREFFIDLMNRDYINYFIGIGKPALDRFGYMEMEPIFLIVAYGIVGAILHYLLLIVIYREFFVLKKIEPNIFLYVSSATIFYLIFSIGFFFFRETYSGLPYFIIIGYLLGYLQKIKRYVH